jgi:tryptophan synthase alpha chain
VLENVLRQKLEKSGILLMTHIVLGYPDFDASARIVEAMVRAGVDLMELQIPFSEPIADGPVILRANQEALSRGATVKRCMEFGAEMSRAFDIPFLYMTYCNIPFKYGMDRFAGDASRAGIRGIILPDLPPEEGREYLDAMARHALAPIFIFAPTTRIDRMRTIASLAGGFIYCVARKGVTGAETSFSRELDDYLARCRTATNLPLAVGFGVKDRADVDFLKGKADIAVIGTQTIRIIEEKGVDAVGDFIAGLR